MGRELANFRMEKKLNSVVANANGVSEGIVHVAPKISEDSTEAEYYEVKECTAENSVVENCDEKQDVLGAKSTNLGAGPPGRKVTKPVAQKSSSPVPKPAANVQSNHTVSQPSGWATEEHRSSLNHSPAAETPANANSSPKANSVHSPIISSTKKSQPSSPVMWTPSHSHSIKNCDEEDNWSLTSSAAASVRTCKSKVTVGTAPTFKCSERAEKRKEFYMKLEQKHKALEREKNQAEARTKEEREAAIKQLRKTMVVKANPVPSFYYESPPPKVELKKLPLTRAVSPKFGRRKSCSDASKPSNDEKEKLCPRANRHSIGSYKASAPVANAKCRSPLSGPKNNGTCKTNDRAKQAKETTKTAPRKLNEQRNSDIAVQS